MTDNQNLGTLLPISDHNIRDLGGIMAVDDKIIAPKRLIRGDHLSGEQTEVGKTLTDTYDMNLIIDLRRPSEITRQPDQIFDGVTYAKTPLLLDEAKQSPKNKKEAPIAKQMIEQVRAMAGGVVAHQTKLYREGLTNPVTIAALKAILSRLLSHKTGAVYWHCTAGKDRTGMVSAMILTALGVDADTVRAEYLWTNEIIADKVDRIADFCAPYAENDEDIAEIRQWCRVHPDYFDAVMDDIRRNDGTPDAYLEKVLGLDDNARQQLCQMYLISAEE